MYLKELWELVPAGKARQFSSRDLIATLQERFAERAIDILDVGCGDGKSIDWFANSGVDFQWKGVDIPDSPEVRSRTRTDGDFYTYDGVNIPFSCDAFDVVFSHQVFEHVRRPEPLLREIARVLRPNGVFIGSVSYLEAFHSFSIFNYTPYGWYTINVENGLKPIFLAGGIDSLSLIKRALSFDLPSDIWSCSPLNRQIIEDNKLSEKAKNYKILMSAGHLVFMAVKQKESTCVTERAI